MSLSSHFQCRKTATCSRIDVSIRRRSLAQNAFERSNRSAFAIRRKLVIVPSASGESDGSGMSADQTQKAIDTQLRQSSVIKNEEKELPSEEVSETVPQLQKGEAESVQRDVAFRTGSMDEEQISKAIERQVEAPLAKAESVQRDVASRTGSMDEEQMSKAIERQVEAPLAKAESVQRDVASRTGSMDEEQISKAIERQVDATPASFKKGAEAENVQRDVAFRTGSMDEEQISKAMQRQVGATPADWSGDEVDDESMDDIVIKDESASAGAGSPEGESASSEGGSSQDDGTILFTAEALQAVAYDDIKMPSS